MFTKLYKSYETVKLQSISLLFDAHRSNHKTADPTSFELSRTPVPFEHIDHTVCSYRYNLVGVNIFHFEKCSFFSGGPTCSNQTGCSNQANSGVLCSHGCADRHTVSTPLLVLNVRPAVRHRIRINPMMYTPPSHACVSLTSATNAHALCMPRVSVCGAQAPSLLREDFTRFQKVLFAPEFCPLRMHGALRPLRDLHMDATRKSSVASVGATSGISCPPHTKRLQPLPTSKTFWQKSFRLITRSVKIHSKACTLVKNTL